MRRLVWAAMGVALIAMVVASCKKEDVPTHLVQVTAAEGGTVEGQNGEYKEGETVVFTAVPAEGYYFSHWSDYQDDNPRTITISNAEITLTAKFAQNPLLTISADNGMVEPDVNGRYEPGSTVTVTAKPDDGCVFMGWSDGNTDNPRTITIGNPRIITPNQDISLTALFAVMVFEPTVDLGLESGTLWATCNLGATKPWEFGDYYAWGETQTKDDYSWETYKYCKGSGETLTKYCYDAEWGYDGFTDTLTTLEAADDAATAVLGAGWAMPTNAECDELNSQCYWVWTMNYNNQNVSGCIVYKAKSASDKGIKVYDGAPSASYSMTDAHIFLPAAGIHHEDGYVGGVGNSGIYWSNSLYWYRPHSACINYFNRSWSSEICSRYEGCSIRPVKRP